MSQNETELADVRAIAEKNRQHIKTIASAIEASISDEEGKKKADWAGLMRMRAPREKEAAQPSEAEELFALMQENAENLERLSKAVGGGIPEWHDASGRRFDKSWDATMGVAGSGEEGD